MPFKIVQTFEKGRENLFIVPSSWEWNGQLRYPKKKTEYKLAKDEHSKPRPEWNLMTCKTKRKGFVTYDDAEEELAIMAHHSDTDLGGPAPQEGNQTFDMSMTNFNDMADQLMLNTNAAAASTSTPMVIQEEAEQTYFFLKNDDMITTSETTIQAQPNDIVIQKLNIILENQNHLIEQQQKFAQRLGNFVIEMETRVEKTVNRIFNPNVTSLSDAASSAENRRISIKPIDSIPDLEHLELLLTDSEKKDGLIKTYSILCTASEGSGVTCAYTLLDVLFTREFLCKCSWSGGSRGDRIKVALKGYKNILDFFFRMILKWDNQFTIEENEKFFKTVLRNAEQRKNLRNLRKSSKRRRTKENEKPEAETRPETERDETRVRETDKASEDLVANIAKTTNQQPSEVAVSSDFRVKGLVDDTAFTL